MRKYNKLKRLGTSEVEGILYGECYIYPKLDGTNARISYDPTTETLVAGGRNRVLKEGDNHFGFQEWVKDNSEKILKFMRVFCSLYNLDMDRLTLYGEWLVPHTLKTYEETAWRRFYLFDVHVDVDVWGYAHQNLWEAEARDAGLDVVPVLDILKHPTEDDIGHLASTCDYLIKEDQGVGEGVVIKNYAWTNSYGDTTWAKYITSEFSSNTGNPYPQESGVPLERTIAYDHVTKALVDKERAKIDGEYQGETPRHIMIPRLLNQVWYCVVTEDMWDIIKKNKLRTLDVAGLKRFVSERTKECAEDLF